MIRLLLAFLLLPLAAACATVPERAPFASDRIAVAVRGEGPDVVLIPGLSSSPEVWESTVAAVPGYRYHLVHVAGFAGKAPGANASGPVVAPVADEIARYVREAGLRRPALVGHSLGGSWAMMVAARNPGLAARVMVVDMVPFLGGMVGGPGATAESVAGIAGQFRDGMRTRGPQRDAMVAQTIDTMVRDESLRPLALRHSMTSDPDVSAQAMYDLITTDLRPELARIDVPLTVLWVQAPNAPVPQAQMEQFYRLSYANAPQADVRRIPDAWHFIMWDEPDLFRRELSAFLAAGR
jgi:pimeloyl-ACP methyl ester carboxylesterase